VRSYFYRAYYPTYLRGCVYVLIFILAFSAFLIFEFSHWLQQQIKVFFINAVSFYLHSFTGVAAEGTRGSFLRSKNLGCEKIV